MQAEQAAPAPPATADTESLVRVINNNGAVSSEEGRRSPELGDEAGEAWCGAGEVTRPTPQLPDKKPWLSPMMPNPLLSLPTLNFSVSQVSQTCTQ